MDTLSIGEHLDKMREMGIASVEVPEWTPREGMVYRIEDLPPEWISPQGGETLCEEAQETALVYAAEGVGFLCFSHPFYHQIFWHPSTNGMVNRAIEAKRERLLDRVQKRDWGSLFVYYERPYRSELLYTFNEWRKGSESETLPGLHDHPGLHEYFDLEDRKFCRIAKEIWVDNENIGQCLPLWEEIWTAFADGTLWMDEDDVDAMEDWDDEIDIWRGECNDGGYSWSLSQTTAEFFANRGLNDSTGEVSRARIPKSLVYAYFSDRNESEVIVLEDITAYLLPV